MRIEVAYDRRIKVFDTDCFTETQPFSGKSMLATPKETAAIESVAMDGSTVLARLFGELVDVAKINRACFPLTGLGDRSQTASCG